MHRARSWFALPTGGDVREELRWVRRMEITLGSVGLIAGAASWSGAWWSWLIIGGSLLSLSPWPGVGAILRKSESRPETLITDPERRKERGRRFLRYFLPIYVAIFAGGGYVLLGVDGAIFFFAIAVIGGGLGVWAVTKMQS